MTNLHKINNKTYAETHVDIDLTDDFLPAVSPISDVTLTKNSTFSKNELAPFEPSQAPKKVSIGENEPLKLAVVGHTNTGKTSILRTLLRDVYFGEVKNAPATTRHVEKAMLTDSQTGQELVALYDTPGLEDASGLLDWLEDNTASRRDGVERLQQFLASPIAQDLSLIHI